MFDEYIPSNLINVIKGMFYWNDIWCPFVPCQKYGVGVWLPIDKHVWVH